MAWIESHQSLKEHPKTLHLAETLDIDVPFAIGLLHCFWWWCLDYAEDGDLSRFSPRTIARGSLWTKDPTLFLNALITAGFIDKTESSLRIHDWDEYSGRLVERRRQDRERKRQAFHRNSSGLPTDILPTSKGIPPDLPRHSSVTDQPTNSVPTKTNKETVPPIIPLKGDAHPKKFFPRRSHNNYQVDPTKFSKGLTGLIIERDKGRLDMLAGEADQNLGGPELK